MNRHRFAVVGGSVALLSAVVVPVAHAAWNGSVAGSGGAKAGSLGQPTLGAALSCTNGTPGNGHNNQIGLTVTWTRSGEGWLTSQKVYLDTNSTPSTVVGTPTSGATSFQWWFAAGKSTAYYMSVTSVAGAWEGAEPTALSYTSSASKNC